MPVCLRSYRAMSQFALVEINPIGLGWVAQQQSCPLSFRLCRAGPTRRPSRMRPGTPSVGRSDAWFSPFTRFARCGRCGVEKMPSKSSKLATPLFPFSTFKLLILSAFTFCSRPLNLRDNITSPFSGAHTRPSPFVRGDTGLFSAW